MLSLNKKTFKKIEETEEEFREKVKTVNSLLSLAIQQDDLIAIEKILKEEKVTIWIRSVQVAVKQGSVEILEMMLKYGWWVDARRANGSETALVLAIKLQKTDMVRFLVEQGSDVNSEKSPPLRSACLVGNLLSVKLLIEFGAELKTRNNTALHHAAQGGHLEVVQFLIEQKGIEMEAINRQHQRPLDVAIANNHLPVVEYLIDSGCQIEGPNIRKKLMGNIFANSDLSIIKFLQSKGYSLDQHDNRQRTGLHYMANSNNLEGVQFLLNNGVNVNVVSKMGNTPLHYAASNGSLPIVQALVDYGAKIDPKNHSNITPLMWTAENGHLEVVKFLVEKGSRVQARTKKGQTVFDFANGHLEVLQFLEKLKISR